MGCIGSVTALQMFRVCQTLYGIVAQRLELSDETVVGSNPTYSTILCSRGEIGRHAGFRSLCRWHTGSTPVESTIFFDNEIVNAKLGKRKGVIV